MRFKGVKIAVNCSFSICFFVFSFLIFSYWGRKNEGRREEGRGRGRVGDKKNKVWKKLILCLILIFSNLFIL